MNDLKLGYKEVAIILGIEYYDAKRIVWRALNPDTDILEFVPSKIGVNTKAPLTSFKSKTTSWIDELHGKNYLQHMVYCIHANGLSTTTCTNILCDIDCIIKADLVGDYKVFKDILSPKHLQEIIGTLVKRRGEYLSSGEKVPSRLLKFVSKVDIKSTCYKIPYED